MDEFLSESAQRAVRAAQRWAARLVAQRVEPAHLVLGIAEQEESRGATLLAAHGFRATQARAALNVPAGSADNDTAAVPAFSEPVRQAIANARRCSVERGPDNPAGTDVLLRELLGAHRELISWLDSVGADGERLLGELTDAAAAEGRPLEAEFTELDLSDTVEMLAVYRALDAAANRAREGLRVLEDYARFMLDDSSLTGELKSLRHDLRAGLDDLPRLALLESRDTEHDVGTAIGTAAEWTRSDVQDVVAANFKRVQEALRSLEEFGKLESPRAARAIEKLRYRLYTVERSAAVGYDSRVRLEGVVLYVIVGSQSCRGGVEWTVREALAGGAQVIQLREKGTPDGELLELARRVRRSTRDAGALFVMNDRPDLARLADADGVHVGQDELSVRDARRIAGSRAIIGLSTHSIEQARRAVLDGANYIGVGPLFPSQTKSFGEFRGPELIRQVQAEIRLPAFAIGGVSLDNLDQVLAAGATRVAVSAAICSADDPRAAAAQFRHRLRWASAHEEPGQQRGAGNREHAG